MVINSCQMLIISARQAVEVTGSASMVQAQTTSVGQVIDDRRVLDLPLNGRQATDLIMLMGMATDTTDQNLTDLKTSIEVSYGHPASSACSVDFPRSWRA